MWIGTAQRWFIRNQQIFEVTTNLKNDLTCNKRQVKNVSPVPRQLNCKNSKYWIYKLIRINQSKSYLIKKRVNETIATYQGIQLTHSLSGTFTPVQTQPHSFSQITKTIGTQIFALTASKAVNANVWVPIVSTFLSSVLFYLCGAELLLTCHRLVFSTAFFRPQPKTYVSRQ